ncbi:MAG: aldose epimerase family protein [Maribacter sp.]
MIAKIERGVLVIVLVLLSSCKDKVKESAPTSKTEPVSMLKTSLKASDFIGKIENDSVGFYTITNDNGIEVSFSNFGQRIIALQVPDKSGKFEDIVLGYATVDEFVNNRNYYGSVIGRYGNRIAKGQFKIGDTTYDLAKNNGENHLHGGVKGFESVVWNVDGVSGSEISFSRLSPDMEEGYPGNLMVKVHYSLNNQNELRIRYEATTDKPTVVNLTNHSFFNLKGEGNGDILNHIVMINADGYTPVDSGLIPTGKIENVSGNPFDFREAKTIGKEIDSDFGQIKIGNGYDHNYVLNETPKNSVGLKLAAKVEEPESGRTLEVYTSEPGVQFYTGNFMDGSDIGKTGKPYVFRGSFCFETQHYPDSPNQPSFPSTLLNPGETYETTTIYKFGVVKN